MRLLNLIFIIFLAIVFIIFTLINSSPVEVVFIPEVNWLSFSFTWQIELGILLLITLLSGFFFGFIFEYLREWGIRNRGSKAEREAKRLKKRLDKIDTKEVTEDDVLNLLKS